MESRMPGDTTGSTAGGGAEVHSRITDTTVEFTPDTQATSSQDQSTMDRAKSSIQDAAGQAKDRASDVGHKVSDAASQARQKAGDAMEQAQRKLEESGVLDTVRSNALPALGLAFGLGFLLAGSDDGGKGKHGTVYKAKNQLKGAIMGGLSAAVATEARSLLGIGGSGTGGSSGGGGLLSSLMGGGSGGGQQSGRSQGGRGSGSQIITDTTSASMERGGTR
jgi:ElaB/YqjD/DUF883 family membrane-anchored ribosome-binding protein